MNEYMYKVIIRCFTYNQSAFILDAFEGFAKQRTKFPFLIAVVDDASTDGEQNVIQNYISENFT
jgi:glycosyltransferase involved in cell wall biosynthesis